MSPAELFWDGVLAVIVITAAVVYWRHLRFNRQVLRAVWDVVCELDSSDEEIWGGSVYWRLRHQDVSSTKVYEALDKLALQNLLNRYATDEIDSLAPDRIMYAIPPSPDRSRATRYAQRAVLDVVADNCIEDQGVSIEAISEATGLKSTKVRAIIDAMIRLGWITRSQHRITRQPIYRLTPAESSQTTPAS